MRVIPKEGAADVERVSVVVAAHDIMVPVVPVDYIMAYSVDIVRILCLGVGGGYCGVVVVGEV